MKHVGLDFNYLRKLVQENVVSLLYYRIGDCVVGIFTKPLPEAKFVKCWDMIRISKATFMGGVPKTINFTS